MGRVFSDCAKADLDQRINGCTEAIAQNAGTKRQLTIAHNNLRGSAHAQKGDFERAIADLTKGIEWIGDASPIAANAN